MGANRAAPSPYHPGPSELEQRHPPHAPRRIGLRDDPLCPNPRGRRRDRRPYLSGPASFAARWPRLMQSPSVKVWGAICGFKGTCVVFL